MNTTSAQGHTPGPLTVRETPNDMDFAFNIECDGADFAAVYRSGNHSNDERFAALIARAPTLLSDNAALTAEVARLREALDKIANFTRDITGGPVMVAVARAALEGAK